MYLGIYPKCIKDIALISPRPSYPTRAYNAMEVSRAWFGFISNLNHDKSHQQDLFYLMNLIISAYINLKAYFAMFFGRYSFYIHIRQLFHYIQARSKEGLLFVLHHVYIMAHWWCFNNQSAPPHSLTLSFVHIISF